MSAKFGPYSPVRKAGNYHYVSGQVGVVPGTKLVASDTAAQARQALENLQSALREAGLGMENVVKTTVFLTDMDDFRAVNAVYAEYFTEPYPARSCVQVAGLPRVGETALLVEIEAVAYLEGKKT